MTTKPYFEFYLKLTWLFWIQFKGQVNRDRKSRAFLMSEIPGYIRSFLARNLAFEGATNCQQSGDQQKLMRDESSSIFPYGNIFFPGEQKECYEGDLI